MYNPQPCKIIIVSLLNNNCEREAKLMFLDPILLKCPILDDRFVIATYYCATKPSTNMLKFVQL